MAKRNIKIKAKTTKQKTNDVAQVIDQGISRHSFDLTVASDGKSPVVVSRKSTTRIQIEKFGTLADANLTVRDELLLKNLKRTYGNKVFGRANCDAGLIRRLGERNYLEYVEGNPSSANVTFKLTKKAF
jgi:hypothetical protein